MIAALALCVSVNGQSFFTNYPPAVSNKVDKAQVQQAASNLAVSVIGKKSVQKVDVIEQVGGKYAVTIEYKAKPGWNNASTRKAAVFEMRRLCAEAKNFAGMDDVSDITICPIAEMSDIYGKKTQSIIARIGLPMTEIKKMDWDGMIRIAENLEAFAKEKGELWWHPATQ